MPRPRLPDVPIRSSTPSVRHRVAVQSSGGANQYKVHVVCSCGWGCFVDFGETDADRWPTVTDLMMYERNHIAHLTDES